MVLEQVRPFSLVRTHTLRRIDARGNTSEVLGTLEGFRVLETIPVIDGELTHFVMSAKKGRDDLEAHAADVQLIRLDLQGRIKELSLAGGIKTVQHLQHLGAQELLFSQWHQGNHVVDGPPVTGMHTDIMRLSRNGETEILLTMADYILCGHVLASRNRIICAEFPSLRTDQTNDAIVAYSAEGQELWRRNLERSVHVQQIQLLESGELIYSHRHSENTIVDRLSSTGEPLGSRTLRSSGQYTFLSVIEPLKDGRLALAGATGPFNPVGSTDTNAMLLVTGTSASDLDAPEIVSNVVASP